MKLFRGDSLPDSVTRTAPRDRGRTFADHFCGTGLMAKFADNGMISLVRDQDLVDLVLKHVGYNRWAPERALAYHSPLLSFSTMRDTAFRFSYRADDPDLVPCTLDEATHFVWELAIELPYCIDPGRYGFTYSADPCNALPFLREQVQRGLELEAATGDLHMLANTLLQAAGAAHAAADRSLHYAELIDVATFLSSHDLTHRDARLVRNALNRASRDNEWLLFPKDPMPDGPGYSCRFVMNRHLKVSECLRLRK